MKTGLDPELLTISGGFIVPGEFFLPPPKEVFKNRLNHLSYDNAAIEMRPTETSRRSRLVSRLSDLMRDVLRNLGLARADGRVPADSYVSLSPTAPLHEEHRDLESVQTFGCSPSLVVTDDYNQRRAKPFQGAADTRYRSAGFHIHQEITYEGTEHLAVAVLDGLIGLSDVLINEKLGFADQARIRRDQIGYGRAGEHRVRYREQGPPILEYRTLSPWPMMSPWATKWAIRTVQNVCQHDVDTLLTILNDFPKREKITHAINTSNYALAFKLLGQCSQVWNGIGNAHAKRTLGHYFRLPRFKRDTTQLPFVNKWAA